MSNKSKSKPPLVSIIIPCYNYGQYINKCIQSALDQTYENIEVIVVDNGSTDNSLEKINSFSNNEKVKIIKFKKNIPPSDNDNRYIVYETAINNSNGEYINILYADDWILPTKIEEQVELFYNSSSSVGVVYCHGYRYIESDDRLKKWKMQSVKGDVFKDYLINGDVVIPISPLVRKSCYQLIGLNNPWTGSEYDFLVMSQYVQFDYVDNYLVVMREHGKNDAKNTHSVYKRVKVYHTEALLNKDMEVRLKFLVKKRMARDFISFGLTFISMMDMNYGKKAIIEAIMVYPLCIFKGRVFISLFLLYIPFSASKYLLDKFGKLSLGRTGI